MHRKKKQSRFHLRCREAVGVDSIAAGMIHEMLYLSANANPQHANVGEKSIVQYQNTGITKLSDAGAAADKWRLVEDFTTR
jgi:hypothetical protein